MKQVFFGCHEAFRRSTVSMLVFLSSLLLFVSTSAQALTVAVVDPVEALSETNQAKSMLEKFRKEAEPDAQQAKKLKDELKNILEKSQKDVDIMTSAQRNKLEKEAEDKQMEYQFIRQKLKKRQQEGRDQILEKLGPKFETVMEQLVKEGKYDIILHRQAVFHSSASIDITTQVTNRINKLK